MRTAEKTRDVDEVAVDRAVNGDRSVILKPREREEAVRALHKQGHSDGQIAMVLGIAGRTVLRIRQRLNISANQEHA